MVFFLLNKKKLIVAVAIGVVALVGDKNSEGQKNGIVAAVCDNVTHGLIGALTWMGIILANNSHPNLLISLAEVAFSGFLSSVMDVDHFLAARSFNLKDAVNLKSRPPMHCTTLVMLIVFSLVTLSNVFKLNWLYKFGWLLATAFISHHIRDGKRRGLWLWPLGSTSPIPFFLYLAIQMLLPHFFSTIMQDYIPFNGVAQSLENVQLV